MSGGSTKRRTWRYWINLLLVALVWGALLFYAGYIGLWVAATARPAHSPVFCVTPADAGHEYEDVTLTTEDGLTLSGWYIPSRNGAAAILLHG